jgi:hypothetical protein
MERKTQQPRPSRVRITVGGTLSDRLATAFEGMTLVQQGGDTRLDGEIADQAQLHGLLARIRDLGLELEQLTVFRPDSQEQPLGRETK